MVDSNIETMDIMKAMRKRHSVRSYKDDPLSLDVVRALNEKIAEINSEGNLHIQLICDEKDAFAKYKLNYGKIEGANNYVALVGKKSSDLSERCGYYGEKIVLFAQQIGLCTCWVGGAYNRDAVRCEIESDESLECLIAIGYGKNHGAPHKTKDVKQVSNVSKNTPEWFENGVRAALLAPTAMNQQKFTFTYKGDGKVKASKGVGFYTALDLGIVKYHFELGAGKDNFKWT